MPTAVYRIYFDNEGAKQEQLDRIDEISVEQTLDQAWEAQIQVPVCVDDKGLWSGEDEDFMQSFKRVRLEIKVGKKDFVPLIDGPVVGAETDMKFEPGRSRITLIVHDDSVYLNRKAEVKMFEGKTDDVIAGEIFQLASQIKTQELDPVPQSPDQRSPMEVQRGTGMHLLRALAERNHMLAGVWPGAKPGESIGKFKKYPTAGDGLADMILLGPDRNVASFTPRLNAQGPVKVNAAVLSLSDKTVTSQNSHFSDLQLLGSQPTYANEGDTGEDLLPAGLGQAQDLGQALKAAMEKAAFALEAAGSVLAQCYPDVLSPARVVKVLGANGRLSGDYLLTKVTHRINRSEYAQTFTAKRNALSQGAAAESGGGPGGLGISASASFNISGSIF